MGSEVNGLRRADRLMAGGAIALLIVMFLVEWSALKPKVSQLSGLKIASTSFSGWQSFTNSRWLWLATAIAALVLVILNLNRRSAERSEYPGALVAGLGALSAALIFYRIVHHPIAAGGETVDVSHVPYSYGIEIGIWLGLLAAVTITWGGYLDMQAASRSKGPRSAEDPEPPAPDPGASGSAPPAESPSAFSGLVVQGDEAQASASHQGRQASGEDEPPAEPPDRAPQD
jgi:hypothetical protein